MPPKILQIATRKKHNSKLRECAYYEGDGQAFNFYCIIDRDIAPQPVQFNAQYDDETQVVNALRNCFPMRPAVGEKIHFDGVVHRITQVQDNNAIEISLTVVPDA